MKVSANSNCPCLIKCIAIASLISISFPSTSEPASAEGSALNFCRSVGPISKEIARFAELWCSLQGLYVNPFGHQTFSKFHRSTSPSEEPHAMQHSRDLQRKDE